MIISFIISALSYITASLNVLYRTSLPKISDFFKKKESEYINKGQGSQAFLAEGCI
jgi:hypothetical protein